MAVTAVLQNFVHFSAFFYLGQAKRRPNGLIFKHL